MQETIFIGGGGEGYTTPQSLKLKYANRLGLIAGATGIGKTVTLQIMAEEFSAVGVPVFLSDVKSDLAGLAKSGSADFKLHDALTSRAAKIGFHDYSYSDFPMVFWICLGHRVILCAQRLRKWGHCCCRVFWNCLRHKRAF